ncbi:MAG: aspartate aminotransferase family protein [Rickettsiales endosymbiont of Dermacentor nuttalli]
MIPKILPVYNRSRIQFSQGIGAYLISTNGDHYLDFASGIAVNALGHCHPKIVKVLHEQANKLWHVSNLYEIPEMHKLAELLIDNSFADTVFFTNSGTEAVECAIKIVRRYNYSLGNDKRHEIITFNGGYHGRTLAALSASNRPTIMDGFAPFVPGFCKVEFNNLQAVKEAITENTAAIMLEPIQGEGGIRVATEKFLQGLRVLADQHKLILICDEIQCGLGRTGKLFAYEHYDVSPDIMTISKAIGNGFPLGACLATEEVGCCMTVGAHGSTFGGNPLAMAVGYAVVSILQDTKLQKNVIDMGLLMLNKLSKLKKKYPYIIDSIRGKGLMIGIKTHMSNSQIIDLLRENKLLTAPAADNVIKVYPPLIVTETEINKAIDIMEHSFSQL